MKQIKKHLKYAFWNFLELFFISTSIILLTVYFVGQPFEIIGDSMLPNFKNKQQLVAEKITYKLEDPKRTDIVILKNPKTSELVIKRVVGLPNETIKIANDSIFINGKIQNEPYLQKNTKTKGKDFIREGETIKIPEGGYVVLGDNRENSLDSRNWGFVRKDNILGKVLIVYLPAKDFKIVQ